MFRYSALPKRRIKVTAPVCAMAWINLAFRARCVANRKRGVTGGAADSGEAVRSR